MISISVFRQLFALFLLLVLPFIDLPRMNRLKRSTNSAARLGVFRFAILSLWSYVLAAVACIKHGPLLLGQSSIMQTDWLFTPWAHRVAIVLAGCYFALFLPPGLLCLVRPAARLKYQCALRPLDYFLPVSNTERWWFAIVSLSAGICEELLYRGFLFGFLTGRMDGGFYLGLTAAWLLSSLAFGTAHLYQGLPGILSSTAAGLSLGLAAILTGGLAAPMVFHALLDLQLLGMYRPAIDDPDQAARLMRGIPISGDATAL
jgi:membrane protease YdiL (CAAX protease family)